MTPVSLPPAAHVAQAPAQGRIVTAGADWDTYVVRAGDTLWDLARRFGTTVGELVARNGLASAGAALHIGDRVSVPRQGSTAGGASGPAAKGGGAASGGSYVVRAGDTFWDIASAAGVDVDDLLAANGMSATSTILPGQRLMLPGGARSAQATSSSTYGSYVVRPGDTAWGVASNLGVDVDDLLAANGLGADDVLLPGRRLTVPGGQAAARSATKSARTSAADTGATTVTVRAGDTLWDIASRYGVSVTSLAKANGVALDAPLLVGDRVTVKGSFASGATQPGSGTLSSSAGANLAYLNSVGSPSRSQIRDMIAQVAQEHGVDQRLALAIAWQESRWTHNAVSSVNAIGVMQCLPSTAEWVSSLVGRDLDLLDPRDNVTCGVVLLRSLMRSTSSEEEAIAAYYQGLTSIRTIGLYDDTRDYVMSVLAYKARM